MMIDTHCHLDLIDYPDIDQVISKMKDNIIIVSGVNRESINEVIDLCNKYNNVYGTIGFHPEYAEDITNDDLIWLEQKLQHKKIIGIGEIGLDYHYENINKEKQKELFIEQIKLGNKYNKTIVIHSRDAIEDTYEILKTEKESQIKAVLHCYSSSVEMAYKFIPLNVMFGIGGVVTFKNGQKLKKVVENIDLKYLLLETDSPYLTPEPFRGKRNEPENIKYVANEIANLKQIKVEEVFKKTTENALSQFDLKLDF